MLIMQGGLPPIQLAVRQGDTWRLTGTVFQADGITPFDWTGWTARFQIRITAAAPDPPLVDLVSGTAGLVLGGSTGTVTFLIPAVTTAALPVGTFICEWKVTEVATGDVSTLIDQAFVVTAGVVR